MQFAALEDTPLPSDVSLGSQLLCSFQDLVLSLYINILSLIELVMSGMDEAEQLLVCDHISAVSIFPLSPHPSSSSLPPPFLSLPRPFSLPLALPLSLPPSLPPAPFITFLLKRFKIMPLSSPSQSTNSITTHFLPFYSIVKDHCMAIIKAITEAASRAENPVEFLLNKQGNTYKLQ